MNETDGEMLRPPPHTGQPTIDVGRPISFAWDEPELYVGTGVALADMNEIEKAIAEGERRALRQWQAEHQEPCDDCAWVDDTTLAGEQRVILGRPCARHGGHADATEQGLT